MASNLLTQKEKLICMLKTPGGAKKEEIMEKLGWQEHSVRAKISLLKKEGYVIKATKEPTVWVYKIESNKI